VVRKATLFASDKESNGRRKEDCAEHGEGHVHRHHGIGEYWYPLRLAPRNKAVALYLSDLGKKFRDPLQLTRSLTVFSVFATEAEAVSSLGVRAQTLAAKAAKRRLSVLDRESCQRFSGIKNRHVFEAPVHNATSQPFLNCL
jgi:hypothetical protein